VWLKIPAGPACKHHQAMNRIRLEIPLFHLSLLFFMNHHIYLCDEYSIGGKSRLHNAFIEGLRVELITRTPFNGVRKVSYNHIVLLNSAQKLCPVHPLKRFSIPLPSYALVTLLIEAGE